ncbi:glycerate kinase [Carboxylicivirga sediminis]|uniref:Glycerate kinase n=1 Tax=Carboxylicivirga sediminis TaxID=2006564 RepID=A0A941IYR0_9BACT|nr:glycerate kinase [Carboxylicivirga sediminis]MBR8536052.1 glycerate kinase [Carboxylicivirga sediminis]
MKKIVIAPDKFKGSLSAMEFCAIVEQTILAICPDVIIEKCPLADGGDGTIDVLRYYIGGDRVELQVNDPLFRPVNANYLLSSDTKTAYIEMSSASGIRLLSHDELNPMHTSTYGTGELIKDAIERGAKHIFIGIGGSSTNDAGMGMARALGYKLLDGEGKELAGIGADLLKLRYIDPSEVLPNLKNVCFEVACDVDNPVYGSDGAAFVYSKQKGASDSMIKQLDDGLRNFDAVINRLYHISLHNIPGSGAAGGLGGGCIAFLNARLSSGIRLVMKEANFQAKIQNADWIITGEGSLDVQTLAGKVVKGILNAQVAQKLAVFCGSNRLQDATTYFDYVGELMQLSPNQKEAIANAELYLKKITEDFVRTHLCP